MEAEEIEEIEEEEEEEGGVGGGEEKLFAPLGKKEGVIQMYPIYGMQLARGQTSEWRMAMGLDEGHMTRDEIRESIPPAYSRYIGGFALEYIKTCKPRPRQCPKSSEKKRKEHIIRIR